MWVLAFTCLHTIFPWFWSFIFFWIHWEMVWKIRKCCFTNFSGEEVRFVNLLRINSLWLKVAFQSGKFSIDNSQAKEFRIEDFRMLLSTHFHFLLWNVKNIRLKEIWNQKIAVWKRIKQIFLPLSIHARSQRRIENSVKHKTWRVLRKRSTAFSCWLF